MKSYIKSYDTLRFLAMLAIVSYHYLTQIVTGGFLAVDIFFLMSGLLITSRLERQYQNEEKISILSSFFRRISKIFVPMLAVILFSLAMLLVFNRELLVNIRPSVLSSLFFVNNWQQILSGQSYFANFLHPSIFTHLWYLAVYAQDILLWLVIYKFIRPFFATRRQFSYFTLILAVLSAGLMAMMYRVGQDPSRVYYGLDTRFFGFALGAGAFLFAFDPEKRSQWLWLPQWMHEGLTLIPLAFASFLMGVMTDSMPFTYWGGIFLFDVVSVIGLVELAREDSLLDVLLSLPLTTWLGKRSYEMYLWYYPVFVAFYFYIKGERNGFNENIWLQMGLILLLAVITHAFLSRKYVSDPLILRQKGEPFRLFTGFRRLRSKDTPKLRKVTFAFNAVIIVMSLIAFFIAQTDNSAKASQAEARNNASAIIKNNQDRLKARGNFTTSKEDKEKKKEIEAYYKQMDQSNRQVLSALTEEEKMKAYDLPITFIGDSLTLGMAEPIAALFPQAIVQAKVGLQVYEAVPIIQNMLAQDQIQPNVVITLGTNGAFREDQMDQILDLLKDKKVYLVNTSVNRPWEGRVNETLKKVSSSHDNVTLINWKSYYDQHSDPSSWLTPDGIHYNGTGQGQWLKLVTSQLK